ncbi:MAG: hypothetical protein LBQ12_06045 [Deltaproteobacteria bacterium]|jgi:hypothetical protein|nr:hypothetical protein [Deltaproteobacteria bacterium]
MNTRDGGKAVVCLTASSFPLAGQPHPHGDSQAAAQGPERVTPVGGDLTQSGKLAWDLALRHGYRGPEGAAVLMDSSPKACRGAPDLFRGAERILDFRELQKQALDAADAANADEPDEKYFY